VKKLGYSLIGVIAILVAVFFFGKNYLPMWISSTLSDKMGVGVFIQRISLSPKTMEIHRLLVDNPPGFILDSALKARKIEADASVFQLLSRDVLINQVTISDLYLGLEFISATNTTGNWTIIMQNLQNFLDQAGSDNPRKFLITTLAVHNINIDLVFHKNDGKIRHLKPIPYMEFKNISSDSPFPMEQLTKVIMSEVLKKIFFENQLKNMLEIFQSPSKGAYTPFRGLFSLEKEKGKVTTHPLLACASY